MSTRYPGGIITKSPVVPTGPYEDDTAPGIWTLDQQLQYQKAGIWPNPGLQPNFIEDVFSTYLYTGNGSTQTITNGIDLSGKGGLVWIKRRSSTGNHQLFDTARGANYRLMTDSTSESQLLTNHLNSFDASGFTLGSSGNVNESVSPFNVFASWTFREQPKFFDVVTYTGNGADSRTIAHSLGSEPGFVIIKRTDSTSNWVACNFQYSGNWIFNLNSTSARKDSGSTWLTSSTNVTIWSYAFMDSADRMNLSGASYVAYFFAHNAGGFGLTGTDNVISCGSYNTDASGEATVNIGYEPQWILAKASSASSRWYIFDSMRGFLASTGLAGSNSTWLAPNLSDAEGTQPFNVTSTGFLDRGTFVASGTVIYIAIRRGPMKVPTDATKVFNLSFKDGAVLPTYKGGTVVDLGIQMSRDGDNHMVVDRLRGANRVFANLSNAEDAETDAKFDYMNGFFANTGVTTTKLGYMFRRAPGFFDEVCWSGSGTSNRSLTHNLTVTPTFIIIKNRTAFSFQWSVYVSNIFNVGGKYELVLNSNAAQYDINNTNTPFSTSTAPTSTQFTLGSGSACNSASSTYVAYLFATVAGVSKVGSYTGTGTTQTINCGFTAGARFVLIKRTDASGDWYVWDSARGIVAGNDPYLLLNSSAAEVTGTDYVDTASSGFEISSTAPAAINANGGSFIFLAIA